jgi:hypothetical protein
VLLKPSGAVVFELPLGSPRAIHPPWWGPGDWHLYDLNLSPRRAADADRPAPPALPEPGQDTLDSGEAMISKRLELALDLLKPSDWERFERLSSVFLATEFEQLRTVASPSGDEGRDAELFSPEREPNVVVQYSVAIDWKAKVNATVRRLQKTIPKALILIYVTNQIIGAGSDILKKTLRVKYGLTLDVRDRSWFVERVLGSQARQKAAEELAYVIVDPVLSSVGVGPHVQSELSSPEAIAAVTFLGLQWQDDTRGKGLTKLAFEAIVCAVLVETSSQNRLPRAAVHARVLQLLPYHSQKQLRSQIDSALNRLSRRSIKHWQSSDEFCLSHDEIQRIGKFRTQAALSEANLQASIDRLVQLQLTANGIPEAHGLEFAICLRRATDAVLFERSQAFAMAIQTDSLAILARTDFQSTLISEISRSSLPKLPKVDWLAILQAGVNNLLTSDDPAVQAYLRSLADSYTLLAFLKLTPDVQGAVAKMFSYGMLWLDTSIVLPLLADTLATNDGEKGRFSRMIEAARDSGLKLFVTPGVIEEVERHMNKALTCLRVPYGQWEGSVPYLLARYVASGRSPSSFQNWLENFRGEFRPLQDLTEYLGEKFDIVERSLESERNAAPADLRHALEQIWHERYERRQDRYLDEMAVTRLVNHDVECYAGIVQLRTKEGSSSFGYSAWWLTVDQQTFDLRGRLRQQMSSPPPDSPVMSADFLVNYLAFGPARQRVTKSKEAHLPLLMALGNAAQLTPELISEAETFRSKLKDLPERVIRRQVRDHLDQARSRIGRIANLGMGEDELEEAILG